jgi:TolB protein
MSKRISFHALLAIGELFICACELAGGGGGGGFNGGTAINFAKGYVFVRKDDRNVYLVDDRDLNTVAVLTTGAGASLPVMSKDGRAIVFARRTGVDSSIEVVPTSGGASRVVVPSSSNASNLRAPIFSPDGSLIVFTFDRGGQSRLGIVNVDGSDFRQLVANASLSYGLPAFSPDGTSIFAAAGSSQSALSQIERIDLRTGMAQNIINTLGNEAIAISSRLSLSPDGNTLAFDARVGSGVTRIFAYELPTKQGPTKVNEYRNEPNTNDSAPTWLNAQTLLYSSDSGGNDNVYRVAVDGSDRQLVLAKAIEASFGP